MKKQLLFLFIGIVSAAGLHAQPGTAVKKQVQYATYLRLQPGEKAMPFYSCMWLNEKNEFNRLVIQHAGSKYSVITSEGRKDNLSLEEAQRFGNGSDCSKLDPHKPLKPTRYTGAKLVKYNADGTKGILAANKNYGPFDEIIFIQESGEKFVAVVKNKSQILYIDSEGKQKLLDAQPLQLITNANLTRAAVLMPPAEAISPAVVNDWPEEKKYAYFDSLSKKKERIWFNNDSAGTIARKYVRLEYDVTGQHFLAVYGDHFLLDGTRINKNISGAGTRLYAGSNGNWAYSYQIYLAFSDGASFQNVINPFFTKENGKDYINWFLVESKKEGDLIKWAKREL